VFVDQLILTGKEKKMEKRLCPEIRRDTAIAHRRDHGIAAIWLLKKGGTI
jgi:hypothetical protein